MVKEHLLLYRLHNLWPTPNWTLPLVFQDCKKLVSHPNFHGGSIETTDSNNIIELNNFSEFGPKKASGDFGSVDSSEFLGTWAFPSQGSLANIELLAAQGSMGPNGSINNSVYVNPFEPGRDGRRRQVFRESPGSPRRRKRMSSRSRSTDLAELDGRRETCLLREGRGPKHKRPRGNQVPTFFTTFVSEKKVLTWNNVGDIWLA